MLSTLLNANLSYDCCAFNVASCTICTGALARYAYGILLAHHILSQQHKMRPDASPLTETDGRSPILLQHTNSCCNLIRETCLLCISFNRPNCTESFTANRSNINSSNTVHWLMCVCVCFSARLMPFAFYSRSGKEE